MALPNPTRNLPDTVDTASPGPTGAAYADKLAAEVQALWNGVGYVRTDVGGSANAITASCSPPTIAAFVHGQQFLLVPAAPNSGAVVIDIDGHGNFDLVAYDGSALEANDLLAGAGMLFYYHAPSSAHRLFQPTARQIIAAAEAAGAAQLWEQIGDSGNLGTVASVEHVFTAGRYSKIVVVASDIAISATSSMVATLRNAAGAIVTLTGASVSSASAPFTYEAEFAVGLVAPSGSGSVFSHFGRMDGAGSGGVDGSGPIRSSGFNATAPNRVRVARSAGNITAGRVIAYGLLATAP